MAIMAQYGVFPAHPQRSSPEPTRLRWSTGVFAVWLMLLVGGAVAGVILSIAAVPPGQDLLDSPVLYVSVLALVVPCALAGWFVPHAAPFWGLAIAPPYVFGFAWTMQTHPAIGADLSLIGFVFLLGLLTIPAGFGLATGLSRRALGT
jgi:hypothetical protein